MTLWRKRNEKPGEKVKCDSRPSVDLFPRRERVVQHSQAGRNVTSSGRRDLFRSSFDGLQLDFSLVPRLVVSACQYNRLKGHGQKCSLEHLIGVDLSGIGDVRVVKQVLNPHHELADQPRIEGPLRFVTHCFDSDRRLPLLFLVQDRQADRAGGVDVWMKERRVEFTCPISQVS